MRSKCPKCKIEGPKAVPLHAIAQLYGSVQEDPHVYPKKNISLVSASCLLCGYIECK